MEDGEIDGNKVTLDWAKPRVSGFGVVVVEAALEDGWWQRRPRRILVAEARGEALVRRLT